MLLLLAFFSELTNYNIVTRTVFRSVERVFKVVPNNRRQTMQVPLPSSSSTAAKLSDSK